MGGAAWLFRHTTLAWLADRSLRRQLPWPYRLFALYCRAQRRFVRGGVAGGELAFRLAARLASPRGGEAGLALSVDGLIVHLDPLDPRMLDVPNEIGAGGPARAIEARLAPGDSFVDLGANHGSFAIVASRRVGPRGAVIACEPQPRLARLIERSLAANPGGASRVFAVACGGRDGEVELFVPAESSGHASLFAAFAGDRRRTVRVALRRFDDLCDWRSLPGRVLVKVDVEGSECDVLAGAERMLRERAPAILLEVNGDSLRAAGRSPEELRARLAAVGYSAYCELDDPARRRPLDGLAADRQRDVFLPAPRDSGA